MTYLRTSRFFFLTFIAVAVVLSSQAKIVAQDEGGPTIVGDLPAPTSPDAPPAPMPSDEPSSEGLIPLPSDAPAVAPTKPEEPAIVPVEAAPETAEPVEEAAPKTFAPIPAEGGNRLEPAPIPRDTGTVEEWETGLPEGAAESFVPVEPAFAYTPRQASVCGPAGRSWLRADYLMWWTNGSYLPPLLTTSDQDDNGILGRPTTEILFGDQRVNDRARHNVRFSGGWWMDEAQRRGIEFDVYSLGRISTDYVNSSTGEPLLARPFSDVLLQRQNSEYVAMRQPDPLYPSNIYNIQGTFRGHADEDFRSLGVRGRYNLYTGGAVCLPSRARTYEECCAEVCCEKPKRRLFDCFRVDVIGGYRQYGLDDNFNADQDIVVVRDPRGEVADGTTVHAQDHFHCRNDFNGGELGIVAEFFRQRWSVEMGAKLALGSNSRLVTIRGNTLVTTPDGSTATHHYGWLAAPTNVGRYTSDSFAAIPEFNVDIAYQLSDHWRIHFGYTFLYWANIVRSAEQIDLNINTSYFAGQGPPQGDARPSFDWKEGTFWAQGLNLGVEARW